MCLNRWNLNATETSRATRSSLDPAQNMRCRRGLGSSRGRVRFSWPGYTERRGGTSGREDTLSPQSDATKRSSGNHQKQEEEDTRLEQLNRLALTATFRWPHKNWDRV